MALMPSMSIVLSLQDATRDQGMSIELLNMMHHETKKIFSIEQKSLSDGLAGVEARKV